MDPTGSDDTSRGTDAVAAIVLGGGRSRRFGSDKTRAMFRGTTLLERVLEVVTPLVDEVVVVGTWAPPGVRVAREPTTDLGPLAGLAHGLRQIEASSALVLAGDHPLLQLPLLQLLLDRATAGPLAADDLDAVVPIGPKGPEPLVGWYRRAVADAAEARVHGGERSLRGFLDTLRVDRLDAPVWETVDPHGWSFRDVDSVEDLAALERRSGPEGQ